MSLTSSFAAAISNAAGNHQKQYTADAHQDKWEDLRCCSVQGSVDKSGDFGQGQFGFGEDVCILLHQVCQVFLVLAQNLVIDAEHLDQLGSILTNDERAKRFDGGFLQNHSVKVTYS